MTAGKTEAAKKIMEYIAAVTGGKKEVQRVSNMIVETNPVLEAFGNAKTVQNNNSSRFGKWFEIQFNYGGDPVGGRITNYLLEKSRVVAPAQDERSFHIFYQLLSSPEKSQWNLTRAEDYNFLFQSGCFTVPDVKDAEEFRHTKKGMSVIGLSEDEQNALFQVVATVLNIGNIAFEKDGTDQSRVSASVAQVAGLLGTDEKTLGSALVTTSASAGGNSFQVHLNVDKAFDARDALAKALYSASFDWLVQRINESIFDPTSEFFIGVLDIYGFEIFRVNSFEQLCINFVNEKLQQIFIELTLKAEQEEYVREKIDWTPIAYFNNKPCVELIEGKGGILSLLEEECVFPKATDESYLEKLGRGCSAHPHFNKGNRPEHGCFIIQHYAGDVQYSVTKFLEKNKDLLVVSLKSMLQNSKSSFISAMFPKEQVKDSKRAPTSGAQFKNQVNGLVDTLMSCHPHYIRCIRPNPTKQARNWDQNLSQNQVRYLGLLENVRVRRAGFAYRETFDRFLDRFKLISKKTWPRWKGTPRDGVKTLLDELHVDQDGFQFGISKIFLREPQTLFQLEELRLRALDDIVKVIQRTWRAQRGKAFFKKIKYNQIDIFHGKKERHRMSVFRPFKGDYLGLEYGKYGRVISRKYGDKKFLYSERLEEAAKGKKKKRTLAITDAAIYTIGGLLGSIQRRIQLKSIKSVTLSEFSDGYLCIHVPGDNDLFIDTEKKTEIVSILDQVLKDMGAALTVHFENKVSYTEKKKKREATFAKVDGKDAFAPSVIKKTGAGFAVEVAPGLPKDAGPTRAKYEEQQKPERRIQRKEQVSSNAKWQAKALYDYEAKNAREISFNAGDIIGVTQKSNTGLWQGELKGRRGAFPGNIVTVIGEGPGPSGGGGGGGGGGTFGVSLKSSNPSPSLGPATPKPAGGPSGARGGANSPPLQQSKASSPPAAAKKAGAKFCPEYGGALGSGQCGAVAGAKFCSTCGLNLAS